MGDAEEIADLFMRFPGGMSGTELKQFDDLFHDDFTAEVPSTRSEGGLVTMKVADWLNLQKSLAKGFPDWHWHGKLWKPVDENEGWDDTEEDGQKVRRVHFATRAEATHTGDGPNTLRLEGCDYKPTGKKVILPLEWWTLSVDDKVPCKVVSLKWIKVLDAAGCSSGGFSMIPGILFAIGRPLPPVAQALEYPYPPFPPADAVDMDDPNWWSMRLEIFRKLQEKKDADKDRMRGLIDRQLRELQQHLDYLVALDHYTEAAHDNPRPSPAYTYPIQDHHHNGGKKASSSQ
mmetsp:Transcript_40623/g.99785  ORF Transcript_40623/g.99785 Transcript_40623/m.99785 type:complete len:289 (-) Transcript_40623:1928-2794(-)|eukprot:CAMPEP_0206229588 /NCGR_PEP_ID=MMETSP0047_2-20121206/9784_1 /ASSEMBLY_ACC=CAM_ASM_000192 /TAXON_ID=195065 /ORGANISM="Chroomonas mesostigmatica_cf, Strain CCMP1168" /LENGTH=288 /DNA_ID=CAMNT_0053652911 /DNA_START=82 /DNA_END=948 /DNA_ORIENTATION=-